MNQFNSQNQYDQLEKYLSEHRIVSPNENQFELHGSKFVKHDGVIWINEVVLRGIEQIKAIEQSYINLPSFPAPKSWPSPPFWPSLRNLISGFQPWTIGTAALPPPPKWPTVHSDQIAAQPLRVARQRVPDTISTLTAYRAWRVMNKHALQAIGHHDPWPAKEVFQATCNGDDENHVGCPNKDCECGIWGFKSLDLLMENVREYPFNRESTCVGIVDLWGRYVEHEHGWRAEFAYPRELYFFDESLEPVAANYGVKFKVLSLAIIHQPKGGK